MYCVEPWPTPPLPGGLFSSRSFTRTFSHLTSTGSSRPAVLNFITYLMFIFPQFINNRDVIPPSSFPNEFQTTQHGLQDWCVMYYNVVIVCRLTSPVGPSPYCWLSKLMSPVHMASVRSLPGSAWNKGSCSDVLFTPDCFLTQLLLLIVCMFVGSKTHFLFIIMKYKVVQNTQPIGSSCLQRQTGKVCTLVHANLQNHQSSCLATVVNRGKQLPIQLANTSEILGNNFRKHMQMARNVFQLNEC